MLKAALVFLIIAIVALLFGAGNVAGFSMEAAKMLLYVFLALAVLSALVGLATGRRPTQIP